MRFSTSHGPGFFQHGFFHDHFYSGQDVYDETGIHRGWLAAVGILFILLGVVGLGAATLMTLASVLLFGALAIVGGIVQLLQSFTSHGQRNKAIGAAIGALYLFAGLLIFYNPVASSLVLTLFLAGTLIALGAARIAFSMQYRNNIYWTWSMISGIISIMLGLLIVAQWPIAALWVIGLFVSLEMIFHGAAAVGLSMKKGFLT
jgi:uncharacterized membrane protein HdeD (DUF308 family)